MKETFIEIEGLKKYYRLGENTVKALDGVNLSVREREFIAVIGKSGSGKSTLLHLIGGLDIPTSGEVYVDGKKLSDMKREQLAVFRRRKVGFVFQNYNLVPDLNVYENVVLPIELDGKRIDRPFVREILELLQIADKREALPGMLSGGQQQRVAIARAVAAKPAIILADEPTGNLDTASGHDVMGLLKVAAKQFQQTVILITHDRDIAQMADRIVHIEDGRIVGAGDPDDKVSGGEAGDPYAGVLYAIFHFYGGDHLFSDAKGSEYPAERWRVRCCPVRDHTGAAGKV